MSFIERLFDLSGKTALVTGGSRGLGLQIAHALGGAGARVMISARKIDELRDAQAQLKEHGIEVEYAVADTARDDQIANLADEALGRLGRVDILVNNAGATWGAKAEDYPVEAWDKVFNLNIRGLFLLTQRIGKRSMIPNGGGRVINVASIAGLRGNPPGAMTTIAYNSSKGAVVNFTRALAGEWGPYGITVNAIAPGFFPSKMSQGLLDTMGADTMAAQAPLRRLGTDTDLHGTALLFASDAGRHITGQILAVDGGVSAV
ncbi:SDR family oxidoreductase [Paraburkholderia saeva]|uniref:Gluconate 5-dehydrogenase n=1 Tax=Paraburkholderia saeva TaxID=2777537 RepID=A0A9N8X430_9BURK|nr:SDR family oxidoreductase [Paraburkholderia saeva]CAG4888926.1 Gluconate 5-dehydrogenase [Paraburkholderia saeva]CAG4894003.1 Gluconate 5-dehydrogenase [Paraburkholderia saeva]CAG4916635.1 Gluconate 5-dehydrogenase [Paraburkholderia saeva]